ncbi:TetR family transcriptional regulator [Dictyobacter vulcani]|uniref:TetR family transcriptional regulator n=1 Tax=Dictyobacter vulcani TaxID=2607529 RepID=A0A5J4KR41_9CHLR|nr:TetR/AcrR family transcriptional regulator [Dictyobacter vulcani]GER90083.1 TetR family transcriptional regulator [Dictyobacter vulcani]
MVRTVNEQEYAERRNAILDVTQQLVDTKGYEQMAIQDILDTLQISKGAFYHYFNSKADLLFALVERWGDRIEQIVLPIVQDPNLSALDKFARYFSQVNQFKLEHKQMAFALMRVWYADENAIVRHKIYMIQVKRLVPLLTQIISQGVEEGIFKTPYPEQAARMMITLMNDLGYAFAAFHFEEGMISESPQIARIAAATVDGLERVLGAQSGCLQESWREALSQW